MRKILAILLFFSIVGLNAQENEQKKDSTQTEALPIFVLEKVPTYPGCSGTTREKTACLNKKIRMFIGKNFDVETAKCVRFETKNNEATNKEEKVCVEEIKPGRVRIKTTFLIDKDGALTDITALSGYPTLDAEAIRVLKSLPKMEPGEQRGKKVRVKMALPIMFKLSD